MAKLTIIIPARNEEWLEQTVDDIFKHAEGDTEVIVGFDGWTPIRLAYFPVQNRRLRRHVEEQPVGQRSISNKLARMSVPGYLMKVDAHCSFSKGFDVEMMKLMDKKTILAPLLTNLHAYDWNCATHGRAYQGKKCCDKAEKITVWQPKPLPVMSSYVFGRDFVMKFAEKQPVDQIVETMCLQGSAWMVDRESYFDWGLDEEALGSWGCQGVELGVKAYLNGGRCATVGGAYYGHLFRGPDEFPYERGENPGKQVNDTLRKRYSDKLEGLVKRFDYPLDWKEQ